MGLSLLGRMLIGTRIERRVLVQQNGDKWRSDRKTGRTELSMWLVSRRRGRGRRNHPAAAEAEKWHGLCTQSCGQSPTSDRPGAQMSAKWQEASILPRFGGAGTAARSNAPYAQVQDAQTCTHKTKHDKPKEIMNARSWEAEITFCFGRRSSRVYLRSMLSLAPHFYFY